ncbi:MAG: YraN family protein [Chloroflexota bacterium]|nr:YraN family protein [Chloroflexota bacterium]
MANQNARSGAIGKRGEDLAAAWLRRAGYTILARNWRRPCGELDLIVERDGEIIGVEVKTRTSAAMGEPEEAVTRAKQRKLLLTMQTYLMEAGAEQRPYRLDVLAVRLAPNGAHLETRHYPGAIQPEE